MCPSAPSHRRGHLDPLAEGWDALREPVDTALAGGPSSWLPDLPLLLERAGYREETYFTVSHSSIADDDGRPAGMLGVCTETTGQAARR